MQVLDFLVPNLSDDDKITLTKIARDAIEGFVCNDQKPIYPNENYSQILLKNSASFVTLKLNGALRGCMGSVVPHKPLYLDVADNAVSAASSDPRFPKLTKKEFDNISFSISVLGDLFEIKYNSLDELFSLIEPFKDGLVLKNGPFQGLFLPSVWEDLPSKELFLSNLCLKAGFDPSLWHNNIKIYKFRTLIF